MLCNHFPPAAESNKCLSRHTFCGSGIWEQLWWVALAWGLMKLQSRCQPGVQSIKALMSSWGGRIVFQKESDWQEISIPRRLLAGSFHSLPCKSLHRTAWVYPQHGSCFPQDQLIQERGRKLQGLLCHSLKSHSLSLLPYSVRNKSLSPAHIEGKN